jgi:hypothetical protein
MRAEMYIVIQVKKVLKFYDPNEYLNFIRYTSIYTQQCFPLYQVQRQVQNGTLRYSVLCWFSLSACHLVASLWNPYMRDFVKINCVVVISIHNNVLVYKVLNFNSSLYNSPG